MKTKLCILLAVLLLLTPVLSACNGEKHDPETCLACNEDIAQRYKDFVLSLNKKDGREDIELEPYEYEGGKRSDVYYSTYEELLEHIDNSVYYLPNTIPEWITEAPDMEAVFKEIIYTNDDGVYQCGFVIEYTVSNSVKTKKGDLEYFRYAVLNYVPYLPDYPGANGEWISGGRPCVSYEIDIDDRFDTWAHYFNKRHGGETSGGWTHKGDSEYTNITFWDKNTFSNKYVSYDAKFSVKD